MSITRMLDRLIFSVVLRCSVIFIFPQDFQWWCHSFHNRILLTVSSSNSPFSFHFPQPEFLPFFWGPWGFRPSLMDEGLCLRHREYRKGCDSEPFYSDICFLLWSLYLQVSSFICYFLSAVLDEEEKPVSWCQLHLCLQSLGILHFHNI